MAIPKTKKKAPRAAPRIKRGAKISEPSWDGWQEWSGEQFHRARQAASEFYYHNYKPADLMPAVWQWMETKQEYNKIDIKAAKAAPSSTVSVTAAIVCKMLLNGMPNTNEKAAEYWKSLPGTLGDLKPAEDFVIKRVDEAIKAGREIKQEEIAKAEVKAIAPALTIQQRIQEQAILMAEKIDTWLETWFTDRENFNPKGFDLRKHFQDVGCTQAHARKIKGFYEPELKEYIDLQKMPTKSQLEKMEEKTRDNWEQLAEGYNHLKKGEAKKITEALQQIVQACEFQIEISKANRKPRKKKFVSKEKLVAKLKFCQLNEKYQLASIDPSQIIGANELWVFNSKTRKLGKYVASNIDPLGQGREGSGLNVKGTTIIGFNEKESIQKTLRKPDIQLKEFKDAGKVKLRKFLDEIQTTDTKLNGRINPDTVLLKVN